MSLNAMGVELIRINPESKSGVEWSRLHSDGGICMIDE
jgi:hypothetical protein